MKNFTNLTLEVLSTQELMSIRGGDAPTDPIILKPQSLSIQIEDEKIKK